MKKWTVSDFWETSSGLAARPSAWRTPGWCEWAAAVPPDYAGKRWPCSPAVSNDYYARLEQGRERRPSEQVLNALARALRLDDAATEHLYELAYPRPRPRPPCREEQVSRRLLHLLRMCDAAPAFILGRWMDVLATNRLADTLCQGLDHNDNFLRMCLLSPQARAFFVEWEAAATTKVAQLRVIGRRRPRGPVPAPAGGRAVRPEQGFRTDVGSPRRPAPGRGP